MKLEKATPHTELLSPLTNMDKSAYQHSIKLLSRKDYSEYKLKQKLFEKGFDQIEIEEAISTLLEQNYLRENEYVESRIKGMLTKNYSPSYILQKLFLENAKVTRQDISVVMMEKGVCEEDLVDNIIEKRLSRLTDPTSYDEKTRWKAQTVTYLNQKGFDTPIAVSRINAALANLMR